jgi:hypothetical protein
MVIIVIRIAKIYPRVSGGVRGSGYYTSPGCLIYEWELLLIVCEYSEGLLEGVETCLCQGRIAEKVMDCIYDAGEFRKRLR